MSKLTTDASIRPKPITQEPHGTPLLTRRKSNNTIMLSRPVTERRAFEVGLSNVQFNEGSRLIIMNYCWAKRRT